VSFRRFRSPDGDNGLWKAKPSRDDRPRIRNLPVLLARPRLSLALALEVEIHHSVDEILQSRLIDLFALMNIDRAPNISRRGWN
jgi:hypothetical protein